ELFGDFERFAGPPKPAEESHSLEVDGSYACETILAVPVGGSSSPVGAAEMEADLLCDLSDDEPVPAAAALPAPKARMQAGGWFGGSSGGSFQALDKKAKQLERSRTGAEDGDDSSTNVAAEMLDYACVGLSPFDRDRRGSLRELTAEELFGTDRRRQRVPTEPAEVEVPALAIPEPYRPPVRKRFDHAYPVETRVSVPSDSRFHSIPVLECSAPASLQFVCVPRESTEVFRSVSFTNPLAVPLLEGPAEILVEGEYFLSARLLDVGARATAELGIGSEQRIKVSRGTRYEESTVGLIGGALDLRHEISIEIVPHLETPVSIEVRERVPVAVDGEEKIKVRSSDVKPAWEEFEDSKSPASGCYRWRVDVEPGEKTSLRATYVVQIPGKSEIVGGNRREETSR
ncbi:MAG: DUF4139 domain-containing protein, partial [Planctomycetota bacterium]